MKKAIIIILAALLMLSVFVACNQDDIIDNLLGYSVTFDANGGEGTMESQKIPADGADLNANAFTYTDHTFKEWNTKADGTGTAYKDKGYVKLTSSITLYAQWSHNEAKIAFSANGGEGSMETLTVKTNTPVELPASTLSWVGHVFYGWNTKADGSGTFYGDGAVIYVAADTILYAQWWQPTVSFDANGGTGSMPDQAVDFNIATELDPIGTAITREGYHFTEWNTEKEGTGDHYNDGDEITITEDVILYAQWNPNTYVVSFDANGGSEVKKTIEVTYGSEYGELPTTIKAGSEFLGWFTEDGELVEEDTVVAIAEDHVLTAYWDAMTYKISYETNGGTINSGKVEEYTYGIGATLPTDVTKDGNEFGGWYKNAEFKGKVITEVTGKEVGDKTFYARWLVVYLDDKTTEWTDGYTYTLADGVTALEIPNRITVTGDVTLLLPDGATLTAASGITVSKGSSLTISIPTGATGTGKLVADSSSVQYLPGIGGEDATITITGGNITAIGGQFAAGIGGAYEGDGGNITIAGGTVIAAGGSGALYGGAGIGGGGLGDGGTIIISDGNVTATAGDCTYGGAGIGSGSCGEGGIIEISGGEVTATGGKKAAGIGGGSFGIADISISGGIVTATGGSEAAGIGVGPNIGDQVSISITGGTVTATSGGAKASGIGGGNSSDDVSIAIGEGLGLYGGADSDPEHIEFLSPPTESYTGSRPVYMESKPTTYVKVTFDANTGTGKMDPQTVPVGTGVPLNENKFEHETKSFDGWALTPDGDVKYADKAKINVSADTTLYAHWADGAVVTFHKNDGVTPESTTTQLIPFNTETALTKNSFSKGENYIFVGWNTAKDGTGTAYSDEQKVTLTKNLDLYAQWAIDLAKTKQTAWNADNDTLYSLSADTEITSRITVMGSVTLLLPDGKTLTASKGITVTNGNTLIIDKVGTSGNGNLIANGDGENSGIGSGMNQAGGTVTINGGTVTATGDSYAAGIGGGYGGSGGEVTIAGGTVTATGGQNGAGIGGGNSGAGGTVTINGGTVIATGGQNGAGIGGGNSGAGGTTISISGGSVTANGGSQAAGIGGGSSGAGGTVIINGGTVMANGGYNAAGIGMGYYGGSDGTLTIGTGYVLTGGDLSVDTILLGPVDEETDYTGSRANHMNVSTVSEIKDSATAITLKSGVYTTDKIDDEVIVSERITVEGSVFLLLPDGAKLTASKGITVSSGNTLVIDKYGSTATGTGKLNATGAYCCAGIGGYVFNAGGGNVTINGGTVTAIGGDRAAGIGGGDTGAGGTVTINGGAVTANGGENAAGIGAGQNGSSQGTLKIGAGYVLTGGSASVDTVLLGPVDSETTYSGDSHPRYMNVSAVSEIKDSTEPITLKSGVYTTDKTDDEVIVSKRITVEGSVFLFLPDGKTLTASEGITVSSGNTLVIDKYGSTATGTGILNATGPSDSAGIGGVDEDGKKVAGTVIINNGVVNATAGHNMGGAAGIGSAYGNGGTVIINGGTVTATGAFCGAGIGSGYEGSGGSVTINGGTVTATGGDEGGAGIGGGYSGNGGTVTINGGTVTATGGKDKACGIGNGADGSDSGTLKIADGVIMMVSTNNTDWSAYDDTRTQYMKTAIVLTSTTTAWTNGSIYTLNDEDVEISSRITVTGSVTLILPAGTTLTASKGITVTGTNSLTINGEGTLIATGGDRAAGIGGGDGQAGGTVTINGGTVTATGGDRAAGIGGGAGVAGDGGTVIITGGTVIATGGNNAVGIGAGKGSSSHGTLKIGTGYVLTGGSASADTLLLGPVDSETTYTGDSHPRYMNASAVSEIKDSTSAITLKSGVYTTDKTDDEVIVSKRITVEGSVFLLLPDGKTLTASNGITVSTGNTLVIDKYGSTAKGTGTLTATGAPGNAGIGGGVLNAGGNVTINGGTVTAIGGDRAAGIGGGDSGAGGTVTITGGTVTANGGESAAGIGGGSMGAGGNVTINGGTVTATGGSGDIGEDDCPGIGAGDGISNHGKLTIADGVFMMVSTNNTDWSVYSGTRTRYMKTPTILTPSTTAWQNDVYSLADNLGISSRITVTGSVTLILPKDKTLTASKGITVNSGNSLTINGEGTLNATGADWAAGIGGLYKVAGGTVTINGGTVTANGATYAAGIGGGEGGAGGTVIINGGIVTANGAPYAAGIGGGDKCAGGTVTINGGTVRANGGSYAAGIGGGYNGAGGTISINGGAVTANGGERAVGIGGGEGISNHGTLTIGENPVIPHTDGKLRIASGWTLYYGTSTPPSESIGEGTYDSWSSYAKRYMSVTEPTL